MARRDGPPQTCWEMYSKLAVGLLLLTATAAAGAATEAPFRKLLQKTNDWPESARGAVAYCSPRDPKEHKCEWPTDTEFYATNDVGRGSDCQKKGHPLCTDQYRRRPLPGNWPSLMPSVECSSTGCAETDRLPQVVSLNCDPGKVQVKVIYKITSMPADESQTVGTILALEPGTLASNVSPVRRCQLKLRPFSLQKTKPGEWRDYSYAGGTTQDEVAAAGETVQELDCKLITPGSRNNLPSRDWYAAGKWYSDTMTFNFGGCTAVMKPGAAYSPTIPYLAMVRNGFEYFVTKFEPQEIK